MPRIKDQAICLRQLDWSETSQVVVLLTAERGKVRGLAKGSKRTSPGSVQRFSGGIELLTRGQIVMILKPTVELATLVEWDLQDDCHHLRRDLGAHCLAMYAADLANAMLADHDAHPRAFEAMRRFLTSLRDTTGAQAGLLRFQWDMLDDCGYRPELWRDAGTGEPLAEQSAYTFDARAGGLTRAADGARADEWGVRHETVALLRVLAVRDTPIDAAAEVVSRANRLLCVYARAILDRELPTMRLVLGSAQPSRSD